MLILYTLIATSYLSNKRYYFQAITRRSSLILIYKMLRMHTLPKSHRDDILVETHGRNRMSHASDDIVMVVKKRYTEKFQNKNYSVATQLVFGLRRFLPICPYRTCSFLNLQQKMRRFFGTTTMANHRPY